MNNILKLLTTPPQVSSPSSSSSSSSSSSKLSSGLSDNTYKLTNYINFHGPNSFTLLKPAYALMLRLGLSNHTRLLDTLLHFCFNFRQFHFCRLIFSLVSQPNYSVYNAMIKGFCFNHLFSDSIHYFYKMRFSGVSPNYLTFPLVLKSCARNFDYDTGVKLHALILKMGFDEDTFVGTTLTGMYGSCGYMSDADKVFDEMSRKNLLSWTALVNGHFNSGDFYGAVELFKIFLSSGLRPDSFALVRFLSACTELGQLKVGEWLHHYVEINGIYKDDFFNSKLIDMYAKCGSMEKACQVFSQMQVKDVVTWTAMIQGCVMNDLPQDAVDFFFDMKRANIVPDTAALIAVIAACTRLGSLDIIEREILNSVDWHQLANDPYLATSLIGMYSKYGYIEYAWKVFRLTKKRDIRLWNVAIYGLSTNGYAHIAFGVFAQMEKLGVQPNAQTVASLLCGCTHAGLVNEGRKLFNSMERVLFITPSIEHYGCMVDLLSRAGLLNDAHHLINQMPMQPNVIIWGALLSGCTLHRNPILAEHVLDHLVELEPWNPGHYVHLLNIYSLNGKWDEAEKLRSRMTDLNMKKIPGFSVRS